MHRRRFLAGLLLPLPAALAACGSGDGGGAIVKVINASSTARGPIGVPTSTPTPLPPPELIVSTNNLYQAGAALVSVVGQVSGGSVSFLNRTYKLAKGAQSIYTFVAADADDPVGDQILRADFSLPNGAKGTLSAPMTVLKTQWTADYITVPPTLATLLDPAVTNAELALLKQVYGAFTPDKLWDGAWQVPVAGPITTHFGEQRSYNGGPVGGHHGGTDIGAEAGTPVTATNSGKIAMARQVSVRGNMVIIDHGGQLFSGYAHMSSFAVAEGQAVRAGDLIGYVGSTGLSTGAHLHWEMSVGGVLVDAWRFTDGTNGL